MSVIPAQGKIVVYDTEFTSWEGFLEKGFKDVGRYPEVIQLGAVILDADCGLVEQGAFTTLVRPKVNPELSDYIQKLTQISQTDVNQHGISFPDALDAFLSFIPDDTVALVCYGRDGHILNINCNLNEIPTASTLPPEIDFNGLLLSHGLIKKSASSSKLPELFGLPPSGHAHNALNDARAIASVLRELRRQSLL